MDILKDAHSLALPRAEGSAPDWIQLLPAGTFSGRDGRGPWTCDPAAVVERTLRNMGAAELPIDYDHQIEHAPENGRPAPASGWVDRLEARADGVWGHVTWTERAKAHLAAREYRYISPVYYHTKDGRILALESAALTNVPNLTGLKALAKAGPHLSKGEPDMDILKTLAPVLGLTDAEPTETAVENAVRALAEEARNMKAALASVGLAVKSEDASPSGVLKAAQSLAARAEAPDPAKYVPIAAFNDVRDELGRMKAAQTAALVEQGKSEGKISPAMEGWAKSYAAADPESFRAFLAAAPDLRPGGGRLGGGSARPPAAEKDDLPDTAKALCRVMGVSEDSYRKAARAGEEDTHGSDD